MAFRRRSFKIRPRRRFARRTRRFSKPRILRKISPIEYKTVALSQNTDLNSTGDIIFLHPLSQGTTDITRVGRKYCLKSINISGRISGGNATSDYARVMLVKSTNPNGVAPTLAQLLVATNSWSMRNRLYLTEFKVLYDRKYMIATTAAANTNGMGIKKQFHIFKKLNDVVVCNDGNAGTIADVEKCAYYFIAFSDIADGAGEMSLDYQSQVKYTDS